MSFFSSQNQLRRRRATQPNNDDYAPQYEHAGHDEAFIAKIAGAILARTEFSLWMTSQYAPRTRDLS